MSEYNIEYIIQTRQEIDTIRVQIDRYLWFALFVLCAVGFGAIDVDQSPVTNGEPSFLLICSGALVVIGTLFWVRRLLLQQIADRWFTLCKIFDIHDGNNSKCIPRLEYLVAYRLTNHNRKSYLRQEIRLCIALSIPLYGVMLATALSELPDRNPSWCLEASIAFVITHAVAMYFLLYYKKHLKDKTSRALGYNQK